MRRAVYLLLLFVLASSAFAQSCATGWSSVQASKIIDLTGNPLASGTLAITGVDATRKAISFGAPGGGAVTMATKKAPVSNGAIIGTVCVPRSDKATVYVRYDITVTDNSASGTHAIVLSANDIPITTDVFSLDAYPFPANAYANPPNIFTSGQVNGNLNVTGTIYAGTIEGATAANATHAITADSATTAGTATTATNAGHATTADSATTATTATTATSATTAATATVANALAATPSDCGSEAINGINADGSPKSCIAASGGGALPAGDEYELQTKATDSSLGGSGILSNGSIATSTIPLVSIQTNGSINPDLLRSSGGTGMDGIANAYADPKCATNCTVAVPPTSTSTEAATAPPSGGELLDQRGNKRILAWHNPSLIANAYTPCNNIVTSNCQTALYDVTPTSSHDSQEAEYKSHTWSDPGCWDYGNAFNVTSSNWCVQHGLLRYTTINNRGIGQAQSSVFFKPATGDAATFAYSYGSADGGARDTSHEGITGFSMQTGQTASYFHGTAGTGATTGTQSLPIVFNSGIATVNRNATTDGGNMIDISKGTASGTISGFSTAISGMGGWAYSVPVTSTSVVESTAWAAMPCELPGPVPPQTPTSITCTFTGIQGTTGAFTVGIARINGQFPEQVNITAVGTMSGGTQSVTFSYLFPNHQAFSSMWQGGTQGYLSFDQSMTLNNFRTNEIVLGAVDSSHLAMEAWYGGGGPDVFYWSPISLTNLSKSGTTVTASVSGSTSVYQLLNRLSSAVIAGCSDSNLNGTVSNVLVNNLVTTGQITWTQSGAGTSCSTATISPPPSFSNFHIYPGAEVRGPSVAAPNTIPLEPNEVQWAPGDTIEEPLPTLTATTMTRFTHTVMNSLDQNSNARGSTNTFVGAGISGSYTPMYYWNQNPCTYYLGCGGSLQAVPWLTLQGPNAGAINLLEEPLRGQAVITVGCPNSGVGGCNATQQLSLFGISDGGGNITWNPLTHELGGVNYNAAAGYVKGGAGNFLTSVTLGGANHISSLIFTRDGATQADAFSLCNAYSSTNNISVGNCNFGTNGGGSTAAAPDGQIDSGVLTADASAVLNTTSIALALPIWSPTGITYTGTAGSTVRQYYFAAMSPLGIEGPPFRAVLAQISGTAATLDSSDYVTVPCPTALQFGYPSGTTYIAYTTNVTGGGVRRLGTCPVGSSLKDDYTLGASGTPASNNWNAAIGAGQFILNAGGAIAAVPNNVSTTPDAYFSRLAANTWGVGSSSGAHDGTFHAATGIFDTAITVAGQNVCLANGSGCAAVAPAAAGTLTGSTINSTVTASSLTSVGTLDHLNVTNAVAAGSVTAGNGFSGTKTAGTCVFTIVSGIITAVTGC